MVSCLSCQKWSLVGGEKNWASHLKGSFFLILEYFPKKTVVSLEGVIEGKKKHYVSTSV